MQIHKQLLMVSVMLVIAAVAMFSGFAPVAVAVAMVVAPITFDLEELALELKTKVGEVKSQGDALGQMHTELKAKMEGKEFVTPELKEAIDKALTGFNETQTAITGLKQQIVQMVNDATDRNKGEKSWGEQFIESEAYKSAKATRQVLGNMRGALLSAEVKTVTSANAGGLIRSRRESEVTSLLRERRVVRDLLRTIPVQENSIDYAIQTTRTNNAAPVAEGDAKPYSDFVWSSATVTVRVLAHLAKITRQAMDDAPRLMGEINAEMRYGLGYVEERQFLYGSGVGQNLHGIIPQATAYAKPAGYVDAAGTRIDILRLAMLQTASSLLPADAIVVSAIDWGLIQLTKTDDGAYLMANPQNELSPRLWGLPVVDTPAMDADDFLVGNFQMGAVIYDRMGVEVLISTENVDDFEKNLATVRAEERVAIAVKRPQAFVTGDFTSAIAALIV